MRNNHFLAPVILFLGLTACKLDTVPSSDKNTISGDLLLQNVILVSAEREKTFGPVDVLVTTGKITKIGSNLSATASEVIDGRGKFLTPGLIDSHTHLPGVPGMTYADTQANPDVTRLALAQIPRSYLYHGFTTVIDLNGTAGRIADWNSKKTRPTAYFCGGAPIMDGYPMHFIPKSVRYSAAPYFLLGDNIPPEGIDPQQHTPQFVTEKMKADGAICVKTHHESGFGGNDEHPVPSLSLIRDLVGAAHRHELPVILHANSESAQRFGIAAGVDAFGHGMWTWNNQTHVELSSDVANLLDDILSAEIATQPTVQVLYGERDMHNPDYLADPRLLAVLPRSLIEWYASEEGQRMKLKMATLPYVSEALNTTGWQAIDAAPIKRVIATVKYLSNNNGQLLFGSDTPSGPTYANPPGLNGRLEFDNWLDAGLSPQEIFKAATISNARFFNLDDVLGTLEEGKRADMLLLEKNPMDDVSAYDTIKIVFSQGRPNKRETLSAQVSE